MALKLEDMRDYTLNSHLMIPLSDGSGLDESSPYKDVVV